MARSFTAAWDDPRQFHPGTRYSRASRADTRRKQLIHACTAEKNRIQKTLEDANVKLGSVLTDIFGVTGRAILTALLDGKLSPVEMAARFAKRSAKRKIPEIIASLEAHRLTDVQRFLIRHSLRHLEFLQAAIKELEQGTQARIQSVESYQKAALLLQTIPGIREEAAAGIPARLRLRPTHVKCGPLKFGL